MENHKKPNNNWPERDERLIALRKLSGDGLLESMEEITNEETIPTEFENSSRNRSPKNNSKTEDHRIPLKRRSSGKEGKSSDEDNHDGVRSSKEARREEQVFCGTQLRLGECHHTYCGFVHLSPSELEEVGIYGLKNRLPSYWVVCANGKDKYKLNK
jgi:hypothetical protein